MAFVVDASVALAWFFHDERSDATQQLLLSLAMDFALVPAIWPAEVANALLMAERRKRISDSACRQYLSDLEILDIRVQLAPSFNALRSVQDLARRYELTVYDALYLDLAKREQLPLATRDDDMTRAAPPEGVALLLSP